MFKILSTCKGGGYRYCRTDPPHPRRNAKGLYPLHIVLAENKAGRLLFPDEIVHHRDHDKANDHPDNLEIKTRVDHAEHHAAERVTAFVERACPECGTIFSLKPHAMKQRIARSKNGGPFCSKSCSVKRQNKAPG